MVGEEKATTRGFLKEEYINLGSLKVTVKYLLLHFPSLSNFVLRSANHFSPEKCFLFHEYFAFDVGRPFPQ